MCRFGLAGVLIFFVFPLVESSIPNSSAAVDDISWKVFTKPAVFGQRLTLDCRLPREKCCHTYSRRWLGGTELRLLIMNGVSTMPEKYSEVFNAESYSSRLIIHALNSSDVNIQYSCTYGFKTSVKNLNLSEDIFERYPSEPYDVNITTGQGHVLSGHINLQPVYPKPNCTATFDGTDLSDFVTINSLRKEYFYNVDINVKRTMVSKVCPGLFNLVCNIGTKRLDITRDTTCGDDSSSNDVNMNEETGELVIRSVCIIFILVVLVAVVIYMYVKKMRMKFLKYPYHTTRKDSFDEQGGNTVKEIRLVHKQMFSLNQARLSAEICETS